GWLQGIYMHDRLAPLNQRDVEVGDSGHANLALLDQPHHLSPGIFNWRARFIRPMKLVKINTLHAEPPQRCLALLANRFRLKDSLRLRLGIALIPDHATLGEDHRPLGSRQFPQEAADNLLGMT